MHECDKKECKHEHIHFCSKCLKPYCVDCGKVWEEKCMLSHWPYWTYTFPSYPQYSYTITGSNTNVYPMACPHE